MDIGVCGLRLGVCINEIFFVFRGGIFFIKKREIRMLLVIE